MSLTWPVVLAVLCGALLHASWNALIKAGHDKAGDTALVHILGALVALPFLALLNFEWVPRCRALPIFFPLPLGEG